MIDTRPVEVHFDEAGALPGTLTRDSNDQRMWAKGPRPDPKWTYTDKGWSRSPQMNDHRGEDGKSLPTLRVEYEHFGCDGACGDSGCEGWDVPHYTCLRCDEEITPGVIEGPYQFTVSGPASWSVTVSDWRGQLGEQVDVRLLHSGMAQSGKGQVVSVTARGGMGGLEMTTQLVGVSPLTTEEPA